MSDICDNPNSTRGSQCRVSIPGAFVAQGQWKGGGCRWWEGPWMFVMWLTVLRTDFGLWLGRKIHQVGVCVTCGLHASSLPSLFPQPQQVIFQRALISLSGRAHPVICVLQQILLQRLPSCNPKSVESASTSTRWFTCSAACMTRSQALVSLAEMLWCFPTFRFACSDLALPRRSQFGAPQLQVSVGSVFSAGGGIHSEREEAEAWRGGGEVEQEKWSGKAWKE